MKKKLFGGSAILLGLVVVDLAFVVFNLVRISGYAHAAVGSAEYGWTLLGIPLATAWRENARQGMVFHPGLPLLVLLPLVLGVVVMAVGVLRDLRRTPVAR